MPRYAHPSDVGADIKALHTWLVQGDGTEHPLKSMDDCLTMRDRRIGCAKIKIDTGVHITPPDGYYIELVPNSRIAKTPFMVANSIGIIDPEYTGSMRVILNVVNSLTPDDLAKFLPGNVVGQLILRKKLTATFMKVDELEDSPRGDGGFGSTAKTKPMTSCFACKHLVTPSKCTVQGRTPANMEICVHFCRSTAGKEDK